MEGKYRRDATYFEMTASEVVDEHSCYPNKTFIGKDDVVNVIDNIESDVNRIKDMLSDITGLTEIDEIKRELNDLSLKLY